MKNDDEALEDAPTHRRLHTVRSRLLAMDYNEPLDVESLDLVERMLSDLITTSESYEKLQQQEDRLSQDLALAQAQILPLRKTIARLTRENNQLHTKMIERAEEDDERDHRIRREHGALQGQLDDLRFLSVQKDLKIAEQARRLEDLSIDLSRLLHDHPRGNGVPAGPMNISNFDITATPSSPVAREEDEEDDEEPVSPGNEEFKAEGRKQEQQQGARAVILSLETKVAELQALATKLEEEKVTVEAGLRAREQEVKRVHKMLEDDFTDGKGADRLAAKSARLANERIVDQLNSQVDFLNSQLASREAQMQKLIGDELVSSREARRVLQAQVAKLQAENGRLKEELKAAEERLHQGKAHRKSSSTAVGASPHRPQPQPQEVAAAGGGGALDAAALSKRATEAEQALHEARAELSRRDALVTELRQELEEVAIKAERREEVSLLRAEVATLHDQIEARGKEVLDQRRELSSLSREKEDLLGMLEESAQHVTRLEGVIKVLRSDEAKLKVEVAALRREMQLQQQRGEAAEAGMGVREDSSLQRQHELEARLRSEQATRSSVEGEVRRLASELQQAKDEVSRLGTSLSEARLALTTQQATTQATTASPSSRAVDRQLQDSLAQQIRLQDALQEYSRASRDLEEEVRAHKAAAEQAREEARAFSSKLEQCERELRGLEAAKRALEESNAVLREASGEAGAALLSRQREGGEKDREIGRLEGQLQRLQAEHLSLSRRGNEGQERIWDLEEQVKTLATELRAAKDRERMVSLEAERASSSLSLAMGDKDEMRVELERARREAVRERDLYQDTLNKLNTARAEVGQKEEQVGQLKALFAQLHAGREQLNAKLQKAYSDLAAWEERDRAQGQQARAVEARAEEKQEEIDRLKRLLSQLDEERDALQASLDQQQEAAVQWEKQQAAYERALRRMEGDLQDEQQRGKANAAALSAKEKEVRVLQGQVAGLQQEAAEGRKALHSRLLELRAVNEDLQMMTRENQVANGELAMLMREREGLVAKVDAAVTRSAKAEQLLRVAQMEKDDLLTAYRAVVDERKRLEAGADELSKSRNRLSKNLEEAHRDLAQANSAVLAMEAELQRKNADVAALDRQVESLSRKLNAAQRRLDAEEDEVKRLTAELSSQRAAVGSNASTVRSLEARAATSSEEAAVLRIKAAEVMRERDTLQRMLGEERSHVTELERIIEAARAREAVHTTQSTDLMRANLQLREALRRAGQSLPPSPAPLATDTMDTTGAGGGGGGGGRYASSDVSASSYSGFSSAAAGGGGGATPPASRARRASRESKYSPPSSAVSTSSSSSEEEDEGAGQKTDTSDLLEEGYLASEGEAILREDT